MSVWELAAVTERWVEAHDTEGARGDAKSSKDDKDEIWAWMQTKQIPLTLAEARKAKGNGDGS